MRSLACACLVILLLGVACASRSNPTPTAAANPPAKVAPPPPSAAPPAVAAPAAPAATPPSATPAPAPAAAAATPGAAAPAGRGGRGTPPPPPPPPPAVMPAPVKPIVSDTAPKPDPRVGLSAGTLGCWPGRLEYPPGVDDAAAEAVLGHHELRPGVHRASTRFKATTTDSRFTTSRTRRSRPPS